MRLGGRAGDMGEGHSRVNAVLIQEILNQHGNKHLKTTQFFDTRPYPVVSFLSLMNTVSGFLNSVHGFVPAYVLEKHHMGS